MPPGCHVAAPIEAPSALGGEEGTQGKETRGDELPHPQWRDTHCGGRAG